MDDEVDAGPVAVSDGSDTSLTLLPYVIRISVALVVREYLDDSGRCPFHDWLVGLDLPIRVRIQARILRFETGNLGDHKSVGAGVWEARLTFGSGYRIYFGKGGGELVLLLVGGDKGSQSKDIKRARAYWSKYLEETK